MVKKMSFIELTEVTSAADTLKELLDFYSITQQDFAERIGVSQKHVSELLSRKKYLSPELALNIEQVTGIKAKFLLDLDINYQLKMVKNNTKNAKNKESTANFLKRFDWVSA